MFSSDFLILILVVVLVHLNFGHELELNHLLCIDLGLTSFFGYFARDLKNDDSCSQHRVLRK